MTTNINVLNSLNNGVEPKSAEFEEDDLSTCQYLASANLNLILNAF